MTESTSSPSPLPENRGCGTYRLVHVQKSPHYQDKRHLYHSPHFGNFKGFSSCVSEAGTKTKSVFLTINPTLEPSNTLPISVLFLE